MTPHGRRLALTLVAIFAIAASAWAQDSPVGVRASVEPQSVKVGDVFTLTMQITAPQGVDLTLPGEDADLGEIEVRGFSSGENADDQGQRVVTLTWEAQLFAMGETIIEPPAVTYAPDGGEATQVQAEPVALMTTSVLPPDAQDIKDIRGPRKMPLSPWYYVAYALAALMLMALVAGALWLLLRRKKREAIEPPQPAHAEALAALIELEKRELIAQGRAEEHYVGLSYIARRYLERRYGLDALEATTLMLAREMRASDRTPQVADGFIEMLTRADLVKFAKYHPEDRPAELDLHSTRKLVELTRPREEPDEAEGEEARVARQ